MATGLMEGVPMEGKAGRRTLGDTSTLSFYAGSDCGNRAGNRHYSIGCLSCSHPPFGLRLTNLRLRFAICYNTVI